MESIFSWYMCNNLELEDFKINIGKSENSMS